MPDADSPESKLKPTTNPRQAWVTVLLVVVVSGLFGFLVLPRLKPSKSSKLEGMPATGFNLEVIGGGDAGNRMRLSDLAGKVVVLDFWASWCGPCRTQMPIVEQASKKYPADEVVFMGVNTSDTREDAVSYLRSQSYTYAMLFDEGAGVSSAYGVKGLPTMVVIGKSGNITAVRPRIVRSEELQGLVSQAMTQ